MLSVIMLSAFMLSIIMLSVIMLNVIMLNVTASLDMSSFLSILYRKRFKTLKGTSEHEENITKTTWLKLNQFLELNIYFLTSNKRRHDIKQNDINHNDT